jgi:hypothetical protein
MIWKTANSASSGVICSSWLGLPSLLRIPVIGLLVLLGASPSFSDKASSVVPSIVVDLPDTSRLPRASKNCQSAFGAPRPNPGIRVPG